MNVIAENNGLEVVESGGYAHLHPLPTKEEVDKLYLDDVYTDEWVKKEAGEHADGFWYDYYEYKLRLLGSIGGDTLIDVGSGLGWFINYAYAEHLFTLGWFKRVLGVEPSERSKLLNFTPVVNHIGDIPESFNDSVVHMSLVLEHILDPIDFLKQLRRKAKTLMVVVPNEFNPLQKHFGGDWFVHEHHINYFTPEALEHVLNEAGYRVVYKGATFPMELFLFFGDYRINERHGKSAHMFRLGFEKLFKKRAFQLYDKLHKHFGIGREIVMMAVRNDD